MSTPQKPVHRVGRAHMSAHGEPQTTLRLARCDLDRLRQQMDSDGNADGGAAKREFKRWPFQRTPIRMEVTHPGGAVTCLSYACRNLSRGGVGLLHTSFVHEGSRCIVMIPQPERAEVRVPGKVVRVRHVKGNVHEIGVAFDEPIDVRRILGLDPSDGGLVLEKVNPQSLKGTVLFVEASEVDRTLIRHYLQETNLDITPATSGEEALQRSGDTPEIVLSDLELGDMTGIELLAKLRESGVNSPFILMSADASAPSRFGGEDTQPDIFLVKPVSKELLLSVIGEVLLLDSVPGSSRGAMTSTLPAGDALAAQVPSFLAEAVRMAEALEKAISDQDAQAARRISSRVKGSAAALGFGALGVLAGAALKALASTPDDGTAKADRELKALVQGCRRLRARPEAA